MQEEWHPHPRQEEALKRAEYEILYGGARGGGKTDAGLVWLIGEEYEVGKPLLLHPRYRALVIRKNAEDLADWIDRAIRFYSGFGVDIAYKPAILRFPSGAIIRTGHLKDDQSYTKYMGQEFPRILIEELTQIPFEKRYLQLIASCRSTVPEIKPQIFCTTNPGGLGHGWVKKRFVDPAPAGQPFKDLESQRSRIFIPALVDDNPTLMKADPDYVRSLDALKNTDEELWKAWRLGDWSTFAGQFFREWRNDLHICAPFKPFKIGDNIQNIIVGGMDWGRVDPFSFHLTEITRHRTQGGVVYHRARTFLEVYGTEKTPHEWSNIIKVAMTGAGITIKDIAWVRADTQIWQKGLDARALDIYSQFVQSDADWQSKLKPANKDRIGGWENLHRWFSIAPDGLPYMQIASNCNNAIRTLPELVHDENKVEDVADGGEDHAGDSLRYQAMALKWLDGNVGAMTHPQPNTVYMPQAPRFIDGKQLGMDLDAFADVASPVSEIGGISRS